MSSEPQQTTQLNIAYSKDRDQPDPPFPYETIYGDCEQNTDIGGNLDTSPDKKDNHRGKTVSLFSFI